MNQIKNIVEALLLSSGEPLSADKIHKIINSKESCSKADILEASDSLKNDYKKQLHYQCVSANHQSLFRFHQIQIWSGLD